MSHIPDHYTPVHLIKRLMAIIYDLFLLISLLLVAGGIISTLAINYFNNGYAITDTHPAYTLYQISLLSSFFLLSFVFFGWFWTHGGQTLGMRTWRIQLITESGATISWKIAFVRFLAGLLSIMCFGLGFLWSLADSEKRTWHDILSDTRLIQLSKL
ncbi:MAG: RDD family protein [Gammaproteobacteria bacterium]